MGRYRPPQKPSSPYITPAGAQKLREELTALWKKRREVVKILSAAAAEGDRSENAEYIYRKKQLREMDRRIRYLSKRVEIIKVVDSIPSDTSRVYFGAFVALENEKGEEFEIRIVGADELDPPRKWISIDSPVARALLKRTLEDEVVVELPEGQTRLYITNIWYD